MILISQAPFISPSKNIAQRKIAQEELIRKTLLAFSGSRPRSIGRLTGRIAEWGRGDKRAEWEYTLDFVSAATGYEHELERIQIFKVIWVKHALRFTSRFSLK